MAPTIRCRLKLNELFTFLDVLEQFPIIWNSKLKEYSNKTKREQQTRELLEELARRNVNMDEEEYRVRLKSIKDTYRKELHKVNHSMRRGQPLYIPRLTWYDRADSFLRDVVCTRVCPSVVQEERAAAVPELFVQGSAHWVSIPAPAHASDDRDEVPDSDGKSTESNSIEYVDLNDTTIIKSEPLDSPEIDVITPIYDIWDAPNDSPSPPVTPIASIQPTPCKLVQNTTSTTKADLCPNNVRVPVSEPPFKKPKIEDRFDVYGKNVAYKLREMDKVQRILAEKIINDALFEGEMGALTRHHKLVDESPSGSSPEVHYTGYTPYTAVQCVSPNSSRSESPGSASIHPHSNVSTADESHSRLVLP